MTTRTITLFDRRPVTIEEDEWPVIASASDCDDRARWHCMVGQRVALALPELVLAYELPYRVNKRPWEQNGASNSTRIGSTPGDRRRSGSSGASACQRSTVRLPSRQHLR